MTDIKLTDDEMRQIDALVASPVFGVLRKVLHGYRKHIESMLVTETSHPELMRLQGRVMGIRMIENVPDILTGEFRKQEKVRSSTRVKNTRQ
jgi:hypothetical protein